MAPAPPISPPKRLTRARSAAKKSSDDSKPTQMDLPPKRSTRKREVTEDNSSTTYPPTNVEPLRKSARRIATAAPVRGVKVTPLTGAATTELQTQPKDEPSKSAAKKTRVTRSKKPAVNDAEADIEGHTELEKPKHTTSTKARDAIKHTASTSRGRPKKTETSQDDNPVEAANPPRQSRARGASGAVNTKSLATSLSKPAVPKKRVTFEDPNEDDKENQPMIRAKATLASKVAAPTTGIRARPMRRPAVKSRVNTRENTPKEAVGDAAQRVLTPKKISQVAKSTSPTESDEDELSGSKTPIRDLSQSPRRNAKISRTASPVKRLDFGIVPLGSHSGDIQTTQTLSSPAKRLPPSLYKDAFKDSPKRGDISFKLPPTPRSNDIDDPVLNASSAIALSQSPRRVALDASVFPQSPSKSGRSPFKASLLQSPPKRPASVKLTSELKNNPVPATPAKVPEVEQMSPDVTISSHFRASQSPERSSRVHKITAEELAGEAKFVIDFDQSVVDIRSPLKLENNIRSAEDYNQHGFNDIVTIDNDLKTNSLIVGDEPDFLRGNQVLKTAEKLPPNQLVEAFEEGNSAPPTTLFRAETPVNPALFLFRTSHLGEDEDSSEDELQSPMKISQVKTPDYKASRKSRLSVVGSTTHGVNLGFTPLAAQLSGWLASSPNRPVTKRLEEEDASFSPVAAQHVPGEVVIDRKSPATSRLSTEPRFSMVSKLSTSGRVSYAAQSPFALSTTGSPNRSSYFADEMAMKDLEEEIESMQAADENGDILQSTDITSVFENATSAATPVEAENEVEDGEIQEEECPRLEQDLIAEEISVSPNGIPQDISFAFENRDLSAGWDANQMTEKNQELIQFCASDEDEDAVSVISSPEAFQQDFAIPQQVTTSHAEKSALLNCAPTEGWATPTCPFPTTMARLANTVVSKVPLRPEGEMSPIKVPKKRSRSLSAGPLPARKSPVRHTSGLPRSVTANTFSGPTTSSSTISTTGQPNFTIDDFGDSTLDGIEVDEDDENLPPVTPTTAFSFRSTTTTPSKTPKPLTRTVPSGALQGAVVFVDVHTSEGADASGIFVELLTQMGARCMKNWAWNPRASMAVDTEAAATATPGGGKIGITHVVYKDGGKRTLEKVRDTDGLVKCVGVGWVLDCERENRWLDESAYSIDTSILPRGGSRRRKSMEPRALLNMNGNLCKATPASSHGKRSFSAEMTRQMKEELVNTPVRRGNAGVPQQQVNGELQDEDPSQALFKQHQVEEEGEEGEDEESGFSTPMSLFVTDAVPATPTGFVAYDPADPAFQTPAPAVGASTTAGTAASPTTPYYLSQGAKLVQMTCPPKQTGKGLFDSKLQTGQGVQERGEEADISGQGFPISGKLGDVRDEAMRKKLMEIRRKTLGWRPVVASPLGR